MTGSNTGVGAQLAEILFAHSATVYVAARSADKAQSTIAAIRSLHAASSGRLEFLRLDLADLASIKRSAAEFLDKETRLDVLWNNAGVMRPPQGSVTRQGYELQLGTNCLGHFLFTKLLTPLLLKTAAERPAASSVRVVWVSSSAAAGLSPPDGFAMDNLLYQRDRSAWHKYGVSKTGNILHASEFAQRHAEGGIVSVVSFGVFFFPSLANAVYLALVLGPGQLGHRSLQRPATCGTIRGQGNGPARAHLWSLHRVVRRPVT